MNFLLFLWALPVWAAESGEVPLSRYFTITNCYSDAECIGPTVKNVEAANITVPLAPFQKGGAKGLDGWARDSLVEDGVTFKSEIHLLQYTQPGKYKYYLYAMLRSGKREGVIKKINLKNLEDLKEITLTDKPVKTKKGTVQAQLVIGPPLPLEKKD